MRATARHARRRTLGRRVGLIMLVVTCALPATASATAYRDDFWILDPSRWITSVHQLGRSLLGAENVRVGGGRLEIRLPAGRLDGGEIESIDYYRFGRYTARIRAAHAPSSITGFVLYRAPDFHSEIDIEIYNDPRGRVDFVVYGSGRKRISRERLGFDPTKAFHRYTIVNRPERVNFLVDGRRLHTVRRGLPPASMKLLVNSWFPEWLAGRAPVSDRATLVDWVSVRPL